MEGGERHCYRACYDYKKSRRDQKKRWNSSISLWLGPIIHWGLFENQQLQNLKLYWRISRSLHVFSMKAEEVAVMHKPTSGTCCEPKSLANLSMLHPHLPDLPSHFIQRRGTRERRKKQLETKTLNYNYHSCWKRSLGRAQVEVPFHVEIY